MAEYEFTPQNVVGTGNLPVELELDAVVEDIGGETWESDSPQPGVFFEFEEDGPMTTFYDSGSYIIRAGTPDELHEENQRLLEELADIGVISEDEIADVPFEISNVVSLAKLDQQINLRALVIGLGVEHAEYEPEQFPALFYRRAKYPCTFLVFSNGKVIVSGANSVEGARESFKKFYDEMKDVLPSL